MKRIYTILIAVLLTASVFLPQQAGAQTPQKMSYQAVVRDSDGKLVTEQTVGMQISILQGSDSGTPVYVETQTPTTNANGLVSIEIGGDDATVVSGDFSAIDWSAGTYFIKTETDLSGGANYTITGTSQLLSVPYALHAKTVENIAETDPVYTGSEAVNITATDITNLGNLSGTNTGDQDLSSLASKTALGDSTAKVRSEIPDLSNYATTTSLTTGLDGKVDTVTGKGLSTEDYTTAEKTKLGAITGTNTGDQNLSTSANKISISNGNSITMPDGLTNVPIYTTNEIVALTPENGQAVFNSTEDLYQIYNGSEWKSFLANCWPQPTTASAGSDQIFTDGITSATLAANTPDAEHGTGAWTIVSGTGGSFIDASSPTTTFTGTECTAYTLKWTISTSCSNSSDNVNIEFNQTPTVADAGTDQTFNDGITTATLTANTPDAEHGTGAWTIISGTGGSFTDDTDPATTFTGTECTAYTLKWTISTSCSNSSDNVNIEFNQTPTVADAGTDQTFNDGTTTATLAANTPEAEHGTGAWTIVSGTGGSFTDASSPTTTFTGTLHEVYTLRWTISTNCSSSTDDIIIAFNQDGAGSTLTDADGNTYNTVWIGEQLWMAENLKVTHEVGGTAIPTVTDDNASGSTDDEWAALGDNDTDKAYCYYSNSTDSLAKYGALYTYAAAKNACPTGWHLPSDAEWTELENYIANDGHSGTEGTALKSTSGWYSSGNGTDDYGFSARPGGGRGYSYGSFYVVGNYGFWWSSTEYNSSYAWDRYLNYGGSGISSGRYDKSRGFSVRCVRD